MEPDDVSAYNREHATDVRDVSGSDIDRLLHGVKIMQTTLDYLETL